MLRDSTIEVEVQGRTLKWFRARGYDVPTRDVQLYAVIGGKRVKNGVERRVAKGTKIQVKPEDLMPSSNVVIEFDCEACGQTFTTTWRAHRSKISNNCKVCQAKRGFRGGCHSYWVEKLIAESDAAVCAISGERDKRFLELHHLVSRKNGGINDPSNYVILSSNYHRAFHNWMGGMNVPCVREDFEEFVRLECLGLRPRRRRLVEMEQAA